MDSDRFHTILTRTLCAVDELQSDVITLHTLLMHLETSLRVVEDSLRTMTPKTEAPKETGALYVGLVAQDTMREETRKQEGGQ